MKKADEAALGELHGLFASLLLNKLKTGDIAYGDLNVIRQFLRDNAIDCYGPANETMTSIAAELPKFDEENDVPGNVIPMAAVG